MDQNSIWQFYFWLAQITTHVLQSFPHTDFALVKKEIELG